ncbi:MAG: autotransporter outer membrane beta-barrel domain-containing protein [Oxalobacter sp.]|nr:autotransporter outer membrane beta-barrel domain-containing protein [Oxalobacter sp.]
MIMKPDNLFQKTLLAMVVSSLCASSAFAFNPDKYTYKEQVISADGSEMVKLRVYDQDQKVEFTAEDFGQDGEEKESLKVDRPFSKDDASNIKTAMRYVKAVFGAPSKAPVVETLTNNEEQASFGSLVVGKTGVSGTRLSSWFMPGKAAANTLPIGILTIGDLGEKGTGLLPALTAKGEGAGMSAVIVHEMMHGLGVTAAAEPKVEGRYDSFIAPEANSTFSTHLRDLYGTSLKPGMKMEKITPSDFEASKGVSPDKNTFYQIDPQKGEANFSGAYFTGKNVDKVLSMEGEAEIAQIAWPDGSKTKAVPGIPVNGYEADQDEDTGQIYYSPEMSHLELQNSMMSHQDYRNWNIFMEAELAVLQDIGYDQIDRRKFFGFSIYNNGLTCTNSHGFNSSQDWGVGLHVYGSNNTITQQADLKTTGADAYGIRVDGTGNRLTVAEGTNVEANGTDGIGVLVSYGKGHSLNIQGNVEAAGKGGKALVFDFGGNLIGDKEEYRGSYFAVAKPEKKWEDADSYPNAVDGALVEHVDISGSVKGKDAAIYISDNALVKQVNVLNGASIEGDILSEWSPDKNRYGEYGKGNSMTLHLPSNEDGRTTLTFGLKADENGQAIGEADPDFKMAYGGNIVGPDSIEVDLKGGALDYSGLADVYGFRTQKDTTLSLKDSTIAAKNTVVEGKAALSGTNTFALKKGGSAIFSEVENDGDAVFKSASAESEQIIINKYTGTGQSSLNVDLDETAANQLKGGNTEAAVDQASKVLRIDDNTSQSNWNLHIAEGEVSGDINAVIGPDGQPVSAHERKNSTAAVLHDIAANNFQVFRAQMNDLDKRMGDLRNMPDSEGGAWAKVIAGQSKYKGIHNDYKTLQVGVDHRYKGFFGGVTAAYTDGDGSIKHGSTDDKNYTFGLYGGWLGEDGQFVDLTLKHHHLETDYDFGSNGKKTKGSYDTGGTSFSVEYGWRLGIADTNYYIEPQAEFMYGHLNSTGYTTNRGVKVDQSSIKSAVGRLGVAAGWASPDKTGSVYIKASVLNDWEADSVVRTSKDGVKRRYHEDMGGTWGEFAVGGTWNINKRLSAYGEMETTVGNPVRTTYQFNAGLRLHF